ncbi:1-(5-phosphoribosyl)-5-amino-4-imidazole-carboxylate carboxylase [Candidatus Desantisbacteria bacterium CG1_02_38_46]|uniref:1-(5-phosphoribosyl)-5-amino-4-imidazole-carboxylate carboxylase n=3 Tax=unclassified Candidatus Desantisiibacteriota TaxID=3106372 RepID=A0A2H9P9N5_9BACT|nr:MAG: 1-(5-phosphoribosyl)-5-amino-4-imidazole-carboxylate carboxylase [Candidatus Desantisbacteria bacterium CG1_02_38_46]PIU51692.1 MAG: 1-(5-phosphoribosyl)-5-amino-4-imidazole-carboxylate carboxylase [Candidatus Desantisbacteria bacterium CG07_land_8_20_14_0_80_39_15]PIZ14973.1 MAG: 1-(5-phosphoribosyl)-5-amino-4-imidazole-carboxylate carboxylase [Candidatus Desantisbacteria bacterium CG_4_10_14_0_8_um_filter_39_17]
MRRSNSSNKTKLKLKFLPYDDIGFAKVDLHRVLRKGIPEVIFCPGKSPDQIIKIMQSINRVSGPVLATHAKREIFNKVKEKIPEAKFYEDARIIVLEKRSRLPFKGKVLIITAGTGDYSVAEESAVTLETLGNKVERLYDVGVAGIHRLFLNRNKMKMAKVIIVVAGMEGALASVVGGLTSKPVIAVPTSVGYGANFKGIAPLLTMLNCCAPGVVVVNIDNGFGAGYFAHLINK